MGIADDLFRTNKTEIGGITLQEGTSSIVLLR